MMADVGVRAAAAVRGKYEVTVAEDDDAVRSLVTTALGLRGYRCIQAVDGASALLAITSRRPDLLLLDLGLPDMDGVEVIEKVRAWSDMPIIILSARLEDKDKVAALDAGADDYLVKPFSVEELLARIRVALRHLRKGAEGGRGEGGAYRNGELSIDFAAATVVLAGRGVHLTSTEYRLLRLLACNTGKVLTHNCILKEIWGAESASSLATLRVFMAALRRKMEADPSHPRFIQTYVGIGYRLVRVD